MTDDAGRYSLVDAERLEQHLPSPPRKPSLTAERVKAFGPTLAGIAALVTSLTGVVAWAAGALQPDLSNLATKEDVKAIEKAVEVVAEKQRETQHELDQHERDHETREANARALRDMIDGYERREREHGR